MPTALPNPSDWLFCTAASYGKPHCSLWSQGSVTWAFIAAECRMRDICVQAFILQEPFVQVWVQYLCTGKSIRASSCTAAWYGVSQPNQRTLLTHPPDRFHTLTLKNIPFLPGMAPSLLIYDAVFTLGKWPPALGHTLETTCSAAAALLCNLWSN